MVVTHWLWHLGYLVSLFPYLSGGVESIYVLVVSRVTWGSPVKLTLASRSVGSLHSCSFPLNWKSKAHQQLQNAHLFGSSAWRCRCATLVSGEEIPTMLLSWEQQKPTLLVFPDYTREAARGWWWERQMLLLVQHKLPLLLHFLLFLLLK